VLARYAKSRQADNSERVTGLILKDVHRQVLSKREVALLLRDYKSAQNYSSAFTFPLTLLSTCGPPKVDADKIIKEKRKHARYI
tara:strand:- start:487 stop:738 length:252 start_codon:yes stop_codon:yes gene_type:complete